STIDNAESYIENDTRIDTAVIDSVSSASQYEYGGGKEVYDIMYPAVINGKSAGAVNIAYSMEPVNNALASNYKVIFGAGIFAIILISAILFIASNGVIKNINKLK